jgi:hypothetical protein
MAQIRHKRLECYHLSSETKPKIKNHTVFGPVYTKKGHRPALEKKTEEILKPQGVEIK